MHKQYEKQTEQIHHNHQIFEYHIGNDKVLIKSTDGHTAMYDKNHVKGESRPNLLKRLLRMGQRNIKITHVDVEKFIAKHY
jgi:rRNA pseudouridine-1189 N-methylase Emg1 (Nep1/Mra1 family)